MVLGWCKDEGVRWPAIGIAHVRGRSMEPTLHEGDRVLVLYGVRPVTGRLAVVRLPDAETGPRPLAIKRVTGPAPGARTSRALRPERDGARGQAGGGAEPEPSVDDRPGAA